MPVQLVSRDSLQPVCVKHSASTAHSSILRLLLTHARMWRREDGQVPVQLVTRDSLRPVCGEAALYLKQYQVHARPVSQAVPGAFVPHPSSSTRNMHAPFT